MQLHSHEVEVQSGGAVTNSTELTVASSEKIFEIFTSSVYTYKIRAFVRELMTNALDAHIEAGTPDKKFLVTLPDRLEPTFRVRDYGMGLTPDRMEKIYPVLFKSTKDLNNIAVGGFGIGSKSPLCYVESFTVKSFVDKKLYIYTVYKSGSKIKLDLLSVMDTIEPNGVEVSVPIKQSDIYAVETEVEYTLIPFDTKPEFADGFSHEIPSINFDNGIAFVDKSIFPRGNKAEVYARIGCVLYPIDSQAHGVLPDSALSESIKDTVLVIDIPIGAADIQPSREELDYKDRTIEAVEGIINKVVTDFESKLNEIINAVEYNDVSVPFGERWISAFKQIKEELGERIPDTYINQKLILDNQHRYVQDRILTIDAVTKRGTYVPVYGEATSKHSWLTFTKHFLDEHTRHITLSAIKWNGQTKNVGAPAHYKHSAINPFNAIDDVVSDLGGNVYVHKRVSPMRLLPEQHGESIKDLPRGNLYLYREEETVELLKKMYGRYVHVLDYEITREKKKRQNGVYKVYGAGYGLNFVDNNVRMSPQDVRDDTTPRYYIVRKNNEIENIADSEDYAKELLARRILSDIDRTRAYIIIPTRLLNAAKSNPLWEPLADQFEGIVADYKDALKEIPDNTMLPPHDGGVVGRIERRIKGNEKYPHLNSILYKDVPNFEVATEEQVNLVKDRGKDRGLRKWVLRGYAGTLLRCKIEKIENNSTAYYNAIESNYDNFVKHYNIISDKISFTNDKKCSKLELLVDMIRSYDGGK